MRRYGPTRSSRDVMMPELDGFGLAMAVRHDSALRTPDLARHVALRRADDRELAAGPARMTSWSVRPSSAR